MEELKFYAGKNENNITNIINACWYTYYKKFEANMSTYSVWSEYINMDITTFKYSTKIIYK